MDLGAANDQLKGLPSSVKASPRAQTQGDDTISPQLECHPPFLFPPLAEGKPEKEGEQGKETDTLSLPTPVSISS